MKEEKIQTPGRRGRRLVRLPAAMGPARTPASAPPPGTARPPGAARPPASARAPRAAPASARAPGAANPGCSREPEPELPVLPA